MRRSKAVMGIGGAAVAAMAISLSVAGGASSSPKSVAKVRLYWSTDCPIALKYTERINRIYEQFSQKGVEFVCYFPNELETKGGITQYMEETAHRFEWRIDDMAKLAKADRIEQVPCVVVFDTDGKMVYRGAIDDTPIGAPIKRNYLADVLTKMVNGQTLKFFETETQGCFVMPGPDPPKPSTVTFANQVAPILYEHCTKCHSPGQVAPFSLRSYEEARKWSKNLVAAIDRGTMPPWPAVDGYNSFRGANRLTAIQKETLRLWAAAGAPRGDAESEPAPPPMPPEWQLGAPDLVVGPAEPFRLEAEGADVYRNFVIKTDFKETRWVTGMDVKPGNPRVVHHVIAFLDSRGRAERLEAGNKDGQPGYSTFGGVGFLPTGSLGGWAPGLAPLRTPDDVAFELKPGTSIVLQVHYHKSGKPETDLTKVGLYFAKRPPNKSMQLAWIANIGLRIPANARQHIVRQRYRIPTNVTAYAAMPHMHLLGRSMKAYAELPDGATRPLVWVDDWNFNWQFQYEFQEPIKLPEGSVINVEAVYDNSADNPFQPNSPPKQVTWGEETTDEMMLLIVAYAVDSENLRRPLPLLRNTRRTGSSGGFGF